MNINTHEHIIRITVITLEGRLEAYTVTQFREEQERLIESGALNFIVDLSDVEFIDSLGMSSLLSLLKRTNKLNGKVVLVQPSNHAVHRVLLLTHFEQVFTMVTSVDDAIKQF